VSNAKGRIPETLFRKRVDANLAVTSLSPYISMLSPNGSLFGRTMADRSVPSDYPNIRRRTEAKALYNCSTDFNKTLLLCYLTHLAS